MAEMVWIKNKEAPEKGALAFPLDSSSRRLILNGISQHFALDPSSLIVGRVVLLKDGNGLSVMDIDQIRQVSVSAGLGDGLSEQTPIIVTGSSATSSGVARSFDTMLGALAEAFNKKRKRPKVDLDRHRELRERRFAAMDKELYQGNGIYSYSSELVDARRSGMEDLQYDNLLREKVSKFIGSVHIVTRKKGEQEIPRFEDLVDGERRGIATLVKTNGVCLTAEQCIEHEHGGDVEVLIVVKFPRLGACYECEVAARENAVATLEPVQSQSFDACMLLHLGAVGRMADVFTLGSYTTLDVVPALTLESIKRDHARPEVIILPRSRLMEVGAPVLDRLGTALRGVIVLLEAGKLSRQRQPRRKLKSLHGVELNVQSVRDLDDELEGRKGWHKTQQVQLQCPETEYEYMKKAIANNQLVEYTFPVNFKTPIDEWEEKHPLESFSTGDSTNPNRKLRRPRAPVNLLTWEETEALLVKKLD